MTKSDSHSEKPWWERPVDEIMREVNEAIEKAKLIPRMTENEEIQYERLEYKYI